MRLEQVARDATPASHGLHSPTCSTQTERFVTPDRASVFTPRGAASAEDWYYRSSVNDAHTHVRPATLADVDSVATMVAAAFATDPAWSFMIPVSNARAREAFARALLVPRIRRGTVWVTDDRTAVAMWDRIPVNDVTDHDRAAVGQHSAQTRETTSGPDSRRTTPR